MTQDFGRKNGHNISYGFRPIFLISSDAKIISGDGKTEETAYKLGI